MRTWPKLQKLQPIQISLDGFCHNACIYVFIVYLSIYVIVCIDIFCGA